MIDFACRRFSIEDVIKCSLGLTRADLRVLRFLLDNSIDEFSTDDIAESLKLNLSTVQRAVKKLHEKGVASRKQENLSNGGYLYNYQSSGRNALRKAVMETIESWSERVDKELRAL
ncbi:MarR family transcriptional regulator [Candidatus Woesearchaeota archaeon]|nr:MarR family transcriptional regulator [Candidatus Woesearchaeota archaeon]